MRFVGMELIDMSSLGYSFPEQPEGEAKENDQDESKE